MIEFYFPMIWNLVPMVASVGLAVAATLVARGIFARRAREKQYKVHGIMDDPFVSDHAVSRILDKREAVAREACEKSAAEEAANLVCCECHEEYLARNGHECARPEPARYFPTFVPVGTIVTRAVKEPLYDRVFVPPGPTTVNWFVDGVGRPDPNDPENRPKTLADTSTYGSSPVSQGSHFSWFKIQVIPEEGADPDDVRELRNRGAFEFILGQTNYRTFLGPEVIVDGEGADVTVSGKPVELQALEYFKVSLSTYGMTLKRGLWCRVLLKGIKHRALCG